MSTRSPPTAEEAGQMRNEIERLHSEVLHLQCKLGELHTTDLNALRRAYASLCEHVEALEREASGLVADLQEVETQAVPPELVAKELGVAAAVTFGLALLHQTIKALPFKGSQSPVVAKGLWLVGGVFVLARLTGGTLAHVAAMLGRNAGRKRRLLRKLEAVQERVKIMSALQQWAERQGGCPAGSAAAAEAAASGGAGGEGEGGAEGEAVSAARRVSPATSSGSSAEMVEMPQVEELEAAEAGSAAAAVRGDAGRAVGGAGGRMRAALSAGQQPGGRSTGAEDRDLATLRAYVELGKK